MHTIRIESSIEIANRTASTLSHWNKCVFVWGLTGLLAILGSCSTGEYATRRSPDDPPPPLVFDQTGWKMKRSSSQGEWQWVNETGDALLLMTCECSSDPDLNKQLRLTAEQLASVGGGLVSFGETSVQGSPALQWIAKFPQEPLGMSYSVDLVIHLKDVTYLIIIHARETGTTGLRDAMVVAELIRGGQVSVNSETGQIEGWWYFLPGAEVPNGVAVNRSESDEYDARFPDHPLTRVRMSLERIKSTLRLPAPAPL